MAPSAVNLDNSQHAEAIPFINFRGVNSVLVPNNWVTRRILKMWKTIPLLMGYSDAFEVWHRGS